MKYLSTLMLLCGWPLLLSAQEEMHHHHDATAMSEMSAADGVAAGAQAPTGEGVSPAQRCALAARGVVMLDNAAWRACGGKPATVPASVVPVAAAAHHHEGH